MCAIVGLVSDKDNASLTLYNALTVLQHRGQDAAGMATCKDDGSLVLHKDNGLVRDVFDESQMQRLSGNIGIGHVRWATHGIPNSLNAHPHSSHNVSVVHNGIIENSTILKKYLINKGHNFKSQTDTEVIVHLITEHLKTS